MKHPLTLMSICALAVWSQTTSSVHAQAAPTTEVGKNRTAPNRPSVGAQKGKAPAAKAKRNRQPKKAAKKASALAAIPFDRKPLDADANLYWEAFMNRDRLYDFYAKQALHYGAMPEIKRPKVVPAYPGLDGGRYYHWGNQNDAETWKDGRSRETLRGPMVSGVFRGAGQTISRAVVVDLGDDYHAVFDHDRLTFRLAWRGPPVSWTDVRRGLAKGITMNDGAVIPVVNKKKPSPGAQYLGLYRINRQVVFAYLEDGTAKYRTAVVLNGKVIEKLVDKPRAGAALWPERLLTRGAIGKGKPYAIDTLTVPYDNPWKSLFFVSGVDFLSPTRFAISTMHGEVWLCDIVNDDWSELKWKRFATGLHQSLGLKVSNGLVHVMCRDQLVVLEDLNGDDEADFYRCLSNQHKTSAGSHNYVVGLDQDDAGRWYFASGNQGVCRLSADGKKLDILATGFRNPNGISISPDGSTVLTSVQEGTWTPTSAVCEIGEGGHFGAGGPRKGPRGNVAPLAYLPRAVDNSSAGQVYVNSDRWGPVNDRWVHLSFGRGSHFLLLREVINGQSQAAAVPLKGAFLSGAFAGRFSPHDGQLYLACSQGWGSYGVKDGGVQRVRYTGGAYPYPVRFETRDNGVLLTFSEAQDASITERAKWFVQQWNYRYRAAYGSPEFSVREPASEGHDVVNVRSVHLLDDGRRVFIEIPELQSVNQLHLHFAGDSRIEIFATLHQLGPAFTDFTGYRKIIKRATAAIPVDLVSSRDPRVLISACTACHHPSEKLVGPPFSEIRALYANNPAGIVEWSMNPKIRNPDLPPMPSFESFGEETLAIIAKFILRGGDSSSSPKSTKGK
jgi:hypothetical protein